MSLYLLHLVDAESRTARFGHAAHYLGYSRAGMTRWRLAHHADGTGCNLLRHVRADGLGWQLTRVWPAGTQTQERRIKDSGTLTKVCPLCDRPDQPGARVPLPAGAWIELLAGPGQRRCRCGTVATHRRSWGRGSTGVCTPCAARFTATRYGATVAEITAGTLAARPRAEAA